MDVLTLFGLFAVTAMLVCYGLKAEAIGSLWPLPLLVRWVRYMDFFKAHRRLELSKQSGRWSIS